RRDDAPTRTVWSMLGHHDLALEGSNRFESRQQLAGERVGRYHDRGSPDGAAVVNNQALAVGGMCDERADATARVQLHAGPQRTLEQTAGVLERVKGAVARYEAAEVGGFEAELVTNTAPRPQLDALTVLRGQCDLLAKRLFLALRVSQVQPTPRTEVTRDALLLDNGLQPVAVAHHQAEYQLRLALTFGLEHCLRHARVAMAQEGQSLPGQPFVNPDGVFGNQLEISTIAPAGLAKQGRPGPARRPASPAFGQVPPGGRQPMRRSSPPR